ncbi:heterokaryon incompatibility protein-domain-containing protein [Xylaria sp. FL1777]|nr:heterokaryon incompatibility protein-domain-containing protein [Xylaria sp. FL1777]
MDGLREKIKTAGSQLLLRFTFPKHRNGLCAVCRKLLYLDDPRHWEIGINGFNRKIEEIKLFASQGCRVCAIFEADLNLIRGYEDLMGPGAKIFLTQSDNFFYPDSIGLLCGLNATPLRYRLREPKEIEHLIQDVPMDPNTGSELCFNQARRWLKTCLTDHLCHVGREGFTPTRLLKIETGCQTLRLVEGPEIPANVEYSTLSHCWGPVMPHQLTTKTIVAMKIAVPTSSLGKTFRDAARIALELGIHYIWIDCLCIVQDSDQDWAAESTQMHRIYGNSTCTIAATSASDSNGGCFQLRNPNALAAVRLEFKNFPPDAPSKLYLTNAGVWWDRFEREPLNCRAWVVQERFLSPRVLHYDSDQIAWECNCLTACERFPNGMQTLLAPHSRLFRREIDSSAQNLQEDTIPGWALSDLWRPIIRTYTSTGITKPSDRLIAIHGVGLRIQEVCGWTYVAGLFMKNMPSQLVWTPMHKSHPSMIPSSSPTSIGQTSRPQVAIAPSWSWASLDGPINMLPQWDAVENPMTGRGMNREFLREKALCEILGVDRGDSVAERTGLISQAKLQICCYLVSIWFPSRQNIKELNKWRKETPDTSGIWQHFTLDSRSVGTDESGASSTDLFYLRPPDDDYIRTFNGTLQIKSMGMEDVDPAEIIKSGSTHFWARLTWDIWDEFDPESKNTVWLMPVYTVTQTEPTSLVGERLCSSIDGLILQSNFDNDGNEGAFRRLGTFSILHNESQQMFWTHALQFRSVDGVNIVRRNHGLCPDIKIWEYDKGGYSFCDNVLRYQIVLV